jgi:recombination associated protein RdgC
MFPKNIIPYRGNREFTFAPTEQVLSEFKLLPLGSQDKQKFGWVPPLGRKHELLSHINGDWVLLTACKQEKLLPSAAISKMVAEKINAIEEQKGRPLKKKEKDQIRDDVIMDVLPTAFIKDTFTNVWVDTKNNYFLVDCSSPKTAEEVLALLRKTIGSLPIVPIVPQDAVETTLTEMVMTGKAESGYEIGTRAELKSVLDDGATVRLKDEDMTSESVLKHIDENKVVTMLRLGWQDRISFNLTNAFYLKSLSFSDDIKDMNDDIPREDAAARFDADFALVSGELRALLPSLINVFGGLPE